MARLWPKRLQNSRSTLTVIFGRFLLLL